MPNGRKKSGNSAHANKQRSKRDLECARRLEEEEMTHKEKMKELGEQEHAIRKELLDTQFKLAQFDEFVPKSTHLKAKSNHKKEKEDMLRDIKLLTDKLEEATNKLKTSRSFLSHAPHRKEHDKKMTGLLKDILNRDHEIENLKHNSKILTALIGEENYHQGSSGVIAITGDTPIKCRLCSERVPFKNTFCAKPLVEDSGRVGRCCLMKVVVCGVQPTHYGIHDPDTDGHNMAEGLTSMDAERLDELSQVDEPDISVRGNTIRITEPE